MRTAQLGQPYEGLLDTSAQDGGTFTVTGTLPPGLMVRQQSPVTGTIIGGTPTAEGTFTFTVQGVGNDNVPIFPMTYQLAVGPPSPAPLVMGLTGASPILPPGTAGTSYAQGFFVSGGAAPYSWSVVVGQLPPGLALVWTGSPGLITMSSPVRPRRLACSPSRCRSPMVRAIGKIRGSASPSSLARGTRGNPGGRARRSVRSGRRSISEQYPFHRVGRGEPAVQPRGRPTGGRDHGRVDSL